MLLIRNICVKIGIYIRFCVHRIGYKSALLQQYILSEFPAHLTSSIQTKRQQLVLNKICLNKSDKLRRLLKMLNMSLKLVRVVCILVIVDMVMVSDVEARWLFGLLSPHDDECSKWDTVALDKDCDTNPAEAMGKIERRTVPGGRETRCCNQQGITKIYQWNTLKWISKQLLTNLQVSSSLFATSLTISKEGLKIKKLHLLTQHVHTIRLCYDINIK